MSLNTFKKKSVIKHGSKRSGQKPGGIWLPQGPFGHATYNLINALNTYGEVGFSLNGGHRNIGGVGRDMKMSKSGTPFRGTHPIGFGGTYGKYPSATLVGNNKYQSTGAIPNAHSKQAVVEPVLNSRVVDTLGSQHMYIKPSVLSTYGMLERKYKWARYGTYPNYWVQPNYTGNQTDSASQGLYIQNKAGANTCTLNVNNVGTYEGHHVACGPTLCRRGRSTTGFKYNNMASNGPYTKILYQPTSYEQYNLYITRGCKNPVGEQKPFPFAVQTGTSQSARGGSITSFASGCGTSNIYLEPPKWYTSTGNNINFTKKNSRNYIPIFTGIFGGMNIINNTIYIFPQSAEIWAGVANVNFDIYPLTFEYGGKIIFSYRVVDPGVDVHVRFRIEKNPYPDVLPDFNTTWFLCNGQGTGEIIIPSQGNNTFSSLLLYLQERDRSIELTNFIVQSNLI